MMTNPAVRLLMWNMPFHAEHHLYPFIPFHRPCFLFGDLFRRHFCCGANTGRDAL